jgi:hypothetical protein
MHIRMSACTCVYVRVCVCVYYVRTTNSLETNGVKTNMHTSAHLHGLNTSRSGQQPQYPPNRRLEEPESRSGP